MVRMHSSEHRVSRHYLKKTMVKMVQAGDLNVLPIISIHNGSVSHDALSLLSL